MWIGRWPHVGCRSYGPVARVAYITMDGICFGGLFCLPLQRIDYYLIMSDIITRVVDASGADAERAAYVAAEVRALRAHGIRNAREIAERAAEVQFGGAVGIPVDWGRYQPIEP